MLENTDEEECVDQEEEVVTSQDAYVSRLSKRIEAIEQARKVANVGQNKQANKMLAKNKKAINSFKVGDLVLVATEAVDRRAADAKNLLCYILEKKHDSFRVGCFAILNLTLYVYLKP